MSYFYKEDALLPFRTPCIALMCLTAVIALASGSLAAFVEMRLQDRWVNVILIAFSLLLERSQSTRERCSS